MGNDRTDTAVQQDPKQAEALRQRGVHLWFAGVLTIACLFYVPIYIRDGLVMVALLLAGITVLGLVMFWRQWRSTRPLASIPHLIVASTWAAISISAWLRAGRYWDPVIEWLLLVPLVSATMMSARWVVLWTVAAIASTMALWWARAPIPEPLMPRGQWLLVDRIGALVVVAIVTSAWARLRRRTLGELTHYSERLDRTLRLRDDMIAQLSHAFRTPLTTITGVAEQLDRDTQHREQSELLDAAESLLVLIENLMLLTEPELSDSGAVREYSAGAIAQRVRDLLDGEIAGDGHVLAIAAAPTERVRGPGRVLERALIWIGRSALEATDRRPAMHINIVRNGPLQRWLLSGHGVAAIAPTLQQLVTHEKTLITPAGGRRSELYLALRLMQAAEIRVSFDDAVVVLDVPVEPVADPVSESPAAGRVLLAEDHPVNRRIIEELLASAGWQVRSVGDGAALVAALHEAWDLLIVDCEMPVLDGIGAVARVRESGYTGPVIMLTAHATESVRRRSLEAGADAVLIKPLRLDELVTLLANVQAVRGSAATPSPVREPADDAAGIDVDTLDFVMRLRDGRDIIERFCVDAEQRIACGQNVSRSAEERIAAWHSLKGSAMSIGFVALGAAAAACEERMRSGGDPDTPLLAAVEGAWRDVCTWLEESGRAAESSPGEFAEQQQGADEPEPR